MVALCLSALAAANWVSYLQTAAQRPDYRGLVTHVLQEGRSGDLIVLGAPGLREAIEYYNLGRVPLIEMPFTPALAGETAQAMFSSLESVPRLLWVAGPTSGSGAADEALRWLNDRYYPAAISQFGNAQVVVFSTEPDMRSGTSRLVFGNVIELPEAAVPSGTVPRDFPIAVKVSWRPREVVADRLLVQLELVDGSRVVARREAEPLNGTRPTTSWAPGETVVDRAIVPIPDTLPTGSYMVRVALFDPESRSRWKLGDGRETVDLGTIRIGPATRAPL
jgi:hypothetical protein